MSVEQFYTEGSGTKMLYAKAPAVVAFGDSSNLEVVLVSHRVPPGRTIGNVVGSIGLPSGLLETGQTIEKCAVEEFAGETGIQATIKDLVDFRGSTPQPEDMPRSDGTTRLIQMVARLHRGSVSKQDLVPTDETIPGLYPFRDVVQFHRRGVLLPNVLDVVKFAWQHHKDLAAQQTPRRSQLVA